MYDTYDTDTILTTQVPQQGRPQSGAAEHEQHQTVPHQCTRTSLGLQHKKEALTKKGI